MTLSNYTLDNFIAPELSKLTTCGAEELPPTAEWLNRFILASILKVKLPPKVRAYLFNFLRRAEGAASSYNAGRVALLEYLNTPINTISPYFRALANFENCLSQCYQGYELLGRAAGVKLYDPNDDSNPERLQKLYVDTKHMDQMISGGKVPDDATVAVWITNHGLQSSRAALSFSEIRDLLIGMQRLAENISNIAPSQTNPP